MLEIFSRLIGSLLPGAIKSLADRKGLEIICGWGHEPNNDGVGNYLMLWVKIINPTSSSFYFDRIEAVEKGGETFFPSVFRVKPGDEVLPKRNLVALIPCGHVTASHVVELRVYDRTERRYAIKGRRLLKVIDGLSNERTRLESLGLSVHPSNG